MRSTGVRYRLRSNETVEVLLRMFGRRRRGRRASRVEGVVRCTDL